MVSLFMFTALPSPRTESYNSLPSPSHRTRPSGWCWHARPPGPSDALRLCSPSPPPPCQRPRAVGSNQVAQTQKTRLPHAFDVAAKGCPRCSNTPGSLRCSSSPQSKSRFVVVVVIAVVVVVLISPSPIQFTPAASPSSPPSPLSPAATFTTTNSNQTLCTALYAISIACALFDHSPLFLPLPSSSLSNSLLQSHQLDHPHIRNYG